MGLAMTVLDSHDGCRPPPLDEKVEASTAVIFALSPPKCVVVRRLDRTAASAGPSGGGERLGPGLVLPAGALGVVGRPFLPELLQVGLLLGEALVTEQVALVGLDDGHAGGDVVGGRAPWRASAVPGQLAPGSLGHAGRAGRSGET